MVLNKLEWSYLVLTVLIFACAFRFWKLKLCPSEVSRSVFFWHRIVLLISVIYTAYAYHEEQWFRNKLASTISVERAVFINSRSGIREGCGAAIFEIGSTAQSQILKIDIASSPRTLLQRDALNATNVDGWKRTPFITTGDGTDFEYRWLVGLSCAKLGSELEKIVNGALSSPGSYTKNVGESGILLIPEHRLVVFSFSG